MSVTNSIRNIGGVARVYANDSQAPGLKPFANVDTTARTDLLRARTRLLRLYRSLEQLAEASNIETRFNLDLPSAQSGSGLGLDLRHTAAQLDSGDEINASPMSFAPFGPTWDDGSSAQITIGGEYDGTHGSGELGFEVRWAGTHGVDDIRIRVEDPQGRRIRNVTLRDHHPLDRTYDLRNGLYLQLGPGDLINRDYTTIQVSDVVGSAVDPDKPLGGIRNDNPNFQYGMPPIVDGSFNLNGEHISVSTSDTLNDIVDRINQSSTGVTAVFNDVTERIEIVQDTLGEVPTIELQNDTSNFLQASKLDNANLVAGIDPESIKAFDDVAAFSAVQSGNIVVNGRAIALDTANDTLTTMIDKINASPAGVVASFDADTQQVQIEARNARSRLEIDSNGTNFFSALKLPEGYVDPESTGRGISRRRSYAIADSFGDVFNELNYLFRDRSFLGNGANAAAFRSPLEAAIKGVLGESLQDFLGLGFSDSENARVRGDFAVIDRRTFTTNLQLQGDSIMNVLKGDESRAGLVANMLQGTRNALQTVSKQLGLSGTLVDTYA